MAAAPSCGAFKTLCSLILVQLISVTFSEINCVLWFGCTHLLLVHNIMFQDEPPNTNLTSLGLVSFVTHKPLLHALRFSWYLSHQTLTGLTDRDVTTMIIDILILLSLKYREKGGISFSHIPVFLHVFQYRCNVIVQNLVIPLMLMEKLSSTVRQTQIYFISVPHLVQNCITLRQFIACEEQLPPPVWGLGHFSGISFRYKCLAGIMKQKAWSYLHKVK